MNVNTEAELPASSDITDLPTLQALADSQRHRIVTLLIERPMTATELAAKLRIARTRLYYHLDLLEKHGVVRVVEQRVVSGIIERRYRAVARRFRVDRALLAARASEGEISGAQASILDSVSSDLLASRDADPWVARLFLRLSDKRRADLKKKLHELLAQYESADEGGSEIEVSVAFFLAPGEAT